MKKIVVPMLLMCALFGISGHSMAMEKNKEDVPPSPNKMLFEQLLISAAKARGKQPESQDTKQKDHMLPVVKEQPADHEKEMQTLMRQAFEVTIKNLNEQLQKKRITKEEYDSGLEAFLKGIKNGIALAKENALYPPMVIPPVSRAILDVLEKAKHAAIGAVGAANRIVTAGSQNFKKSTWEGGKLGLVPLVGIIALYDQHYTVLKNDAMAFNDKAAYVGQHLPMVGSAFVCQYLEWHLMWHVFSFISEHPKMYVYMAGLVFAYVFFYTVIKPQVVSRDGAPRGPRGP